MAKPTTSKAKKTKKSRAGGLPVPAMAIGGVLLLVVLVVVGIVFMTTGPTPQPKPHFEPASFKVPTSAPFMDTLLANPVQGIVLAYRKHTVPAVTITIVTVAVIVAIIVGIVLYTQHQNKLREDALRLAEEQKLNNDPVKLLLQEPDSFFKKPKYVVGLVGSVVGVLVVIGLVVLAVKNFKKDVKPNDPKKPDPAAAANKALQDKVNLIITEYNKLPESFLLDPAEIVCDTPSPGFSAALFYSHPPAQKYYKILTGSWVGHNESLKSVRVLMMPDANTDPNQDIEVNDAVTLVNMNNAALLGWAKSAPQNADKLNAILQFVQSLL